MLALINTVIQKSYTYTLSAPALDIFNLVSNARRDQIGLSSNI